jgi:lipoic acid synthetase
MVARDDLADGGFAHVARCVATIREANPGARVETLVSDAKGDDASLGALFASRPDVFNHNIETVARLQRTVRPSAGYARSLSVLARARRAGLVTKSGFMLGVGVSIVTIGQYLRPTREHLPVVRWAEAAEFDHYRRLGESLGIAHVESSPLTRSSYHAKRAAGAAAGSKTSSMAATSGEVGAWSVAIPVLVRR